MVLRDKFIWRPLPTFIDDPYLTDQHKTIIAFFVYPYADDVSHLWEAVFMLEYARSNGTNAQFMLLLMKLYGHLGATECITVLFQSLNIKHLQMDSLGYEEQHCSGACHHCIKYY